MEKGDVRRARRYISRALTVSPDDRQLLRLSRRMGWWGLWVRLRARLKQLRKCVGARR